MSEKEEVKAGYSEQYFKPVNQKSMVAFLYAQMGRLAKGEIDWQVLNAQAKAASQINNAIKLEQSRTLIQMKLEEINALPANERPTLRQIETKKVE